MKDEKGLIKGNERSRKTSKSYYSWVSTWDQQLQVLSHPCSNSARTILSVIPLNKVWGTQPFATHRRDLPTSVSFPLLFYLPASTIRFHISHSSHQKVNRESKPRFKSAPQRTTNRARTSSKNRQGSHTTKAGSRVEKSRRQSTRCCAFTDNNIFHNLIGTWTFIRQECTKITAVFHQLDELHSARGYSLCRNIYP